MVRHGWGLAAGLLVVLLAAGTGGLVPAGHAAVAAPPVGDAHPFPSIAQQERPAAVVNPLSGGQGRLFVNTTDLAVVPNSGLRTNITAYFPSTLPQNSAFQVGVEEVIGNDTAVFGIFQNDQTYPTAFFSVFSNVSDATLHLAYWTGLILSTGASYDFALVVGAGTNWTLTVNGGLFGNDPAEATYDFGAREATWAGGISFSEVSIYSGSPSTPAEVEVPLCMAVEVAGGWYLPRSAQTYTFLAGGPQWGVEGRIQDPLLAPGEIVTGSSITNLTNGTTLWTGGPIPVTVTLQLSGATVPSTGRVDATIQVTGPGNSPLPGVALLVEDAFADFFSPSAVVANETGGGTTQFIAPNVTTRSPDLVRATVTLFGYQGGASGSIDVLPAQQVLLSGGASSIALLEGTNFSLTVTATELNGTPAPDLLILFTVSDGNLIFVPFTTTGADGTASLWLGFPSSIESVLLVGEASTPGYWGHVDIRFTTEAPRPTFWQIWTPYLALGIILAVAALTLGLMERSRRRKRRAIPTLRLPPPEPEDVGGLSRTPP